MDLVAYKRVSTDDKEQDADRQDVAIEEWASNNAALVIDDFVDDGVSGSVFPLDRPGFKAAVDTAVKCSANIIVEDVDRALRLDSDNLGALRVALKKVGVRLICATMGASHEQDSAMGRLSGHFKAEAGADWLKNHRRRVKEGMAKARKEGRQIGRTRKPPLSKEELMAVKAIRDDEKGWGAASLKVSEMRGAFTVVDPKARAARQVSASWVKYTYNRQVAE